VVKIFPKETSMSTLAMEIVPRSSEEWALKRYSSSVEGLERVAENRIYDRDVDRQRGHNAKIVRWLLSNAVVNLRSRK
jgi:hypothetical protein